MQIAIALIHGLRIHQVDRDVGFQEVAAVEQAILGFGLFVDGADNDRLLQSERDEHAELVAFDPVLQGHQSRLCAGTFGTLHEGVAFGLEAARGELPGSSAGGEQPKFTTRAMTPDGPRHLIVKFSEIEEGPVSERWRDLLMAEHLALNTLREAGVPAAKTQILDHGAQRFLEVERFDRTGKLGRRALISLAVLDAEFVGAGTGGWPAIARHLAVDGLIRPQAADGADLLWAFGTLIGNSDMHNGNLSFVSDDGRPYDIARAYDMTPMTFAPRSGGRLPDTLSEASIHASVANETWRRAEALARAFLAGVVG